MAENELNDRDAELIAHALKHNTNLHKLYLEENNITATGFEKIRTTIYDPSSFNAMEAGNHTCYCMGNEGNNTHGLTPQWHRRRKLNKMLSTRHVFGSNARHLNAELGEGPFITKLVPRVLSAYNNVLLINQKIHQRPFLCFSS